MKPWIYIGPLFSLLAFGAALLKFSGDWLWWSLFELTLFVSWFVTLLAFKKKRDKPPVVPERGLALLREQFEEKKQALYTVRRELFCSDTHLFAKEKEMHERLLEEEHALIACLHSQQKRIAELEEEIGILENLAVFEDGKKPSVKKRKVELEQALLPFLEEQITNH